MKYKNPSVDFEGQLSRIQARIAKAKRRIEAGKSASGSESEPERIKRLEIREEEILAFLNTRNALADKIIEVPNVPVVETTPDLSVQS